VLALDHRQNLRKELDPTEPDSVTYEAMVEFKRAVVRILAPHATGTLLDPEVRGGTSASRTARCRRRPA
jgi:tagatose-1,6-bisphosphate aldolase